MHRALKLFFVLRTYGAERLREYVRHHIALAENFGQRIKGDARFQLAAPVRFGLVCFRCFLDMTLSRTALRSLAPLVCRTHATKMQFFRTAYEETCRHDVRPMEHA